MQAKPIVRWTWTFPWSSQLWGHQYEVIPQIQEKHMPKQALMYF